MRAILALAIAAGLSGCASQQYSIATYGLQPNAQIGDYAVYDRPDQNRLEVNATYAFSASPTRDAYRAAAAQYLHGRRCSLSDGQLLQMGMWEFTYQCV